ncbi:acyltransferase [Chloroflexota bacterium]
MGLNNWFIRWMDRQLGTATLEERTIGALVRGIVGRFLQYFAMYVPMTPAWRVKLQRMRGVKIGKNVFIGIEVLIDPALPGLISIEDDVSIAGRNMLIAHSDPPHRLREKKMLKVKIAPIQVKRGAWVAAGAIILPGVTIGTEAIVAAGAVVTEDVPPYNVVAGVPARVIRRLEPSDENTD